jgi:DNA-binding response OmpR family regulator
MQTVVVIENDQANRENILRILRFKGFRGIGAEDGTIGLEIAKKYLPDLILCDILMPGLNGYCLLETLGRIPATQNIPVIFVTAKATSEDRKYALSLGVDGYLTKPFGSSELMAAIAACFARSPARSPVKSEVRDLPQPALKSLQQT